MTKILYLCDRRLYMSCSYPECKYTTDPMHAKNFYIEHGTLIEKSNNERSKRSILQRLLQKLQVR